MKIDSEHDLITLKNKCAGCNNKLFNTTAGNNIYISLKLKKKIPTYRIFVV